MFSNWATPASFFFAFVISTQIHYRQNLPMTGPKRYISAVRSSWMDIFFAFICCKNVLMFVWKDRKKRKRGLECPLKTFSNPIKSRLCFGPLSHSVSTLFKLGHSQSRFLYFRLFNTVDSNQMCDPKIWQDSNSAHSGD